MGMGIIRNIYFYGEADKHRKDVANCAIAMFVVAEIYHVFFGYHDPVSTGWALAVFIASPLAAFVIGLPVYILYAPISAAVQRLAMWCVTKWESNERVFAFIFAPIGFGMFLFSCFIMFYASLYILRIIFP